MRKILTNCLYLLGLPKSIYVCLRLCRLKDALLLPIIVSHKTKLNDLSGRVSFGRIKPGIVRVGFGSVETFDLSYQRTILHISGHIYFHGKSKIGKSSRISVAGELVLGENFHISAGGTIISRKKITIGKDTLMAWDSLITDADHHHILDKKGHIINKPQEVNIGDHVWIGARAMILKGVSVPDNCVVGAQSLVTRTFNETNCIIAGNPAKAIKKDINWQE
ncbi:acetyltransferase-like isoleucine patch superfamily enzyme [Oceanisphaera litoralis]|uniref:acyltransferase n=1 Tax=Oceanisphaera litoralis TaxID=225144 RepID=UPI00195CCD4B|nr:acyltransferase [Oceanisphaera litoralis]MBM7456315.1 acetyltransferase-like isoleucine patch superfamily enzyme [Oceanisphaera litoralis]